MRTRQLQSVFIALCLSVMCSICVAAEGTLATEPDFSAIENAVLELGPMPSLSRLVSALGGLAGDELGRAKAIYRWISANIAYDTAAYFGRSASMAYEPQAVLKSGKAVCSGYAALFEYLASALGLEAVTIEGRAKGHGYTPGASEIGIGHDWNAVKINGVWRLIDVTWAAGYVSESGQFVAEFSPFWFDTPPELFVLWHLPVVADWQLLDKKVTYNEYLAQKWHSNSRFEDYARLGVSFATMLDWYKTGRMPDQGDVATLQAYGVPLQAVLEAFAGGELVTCYDFEELGMRILKAPLAKILRSGESFMVTIESPIVSEAAIIHNGQWTRMVRNGNRLSGRITPSAGTLFVSINAVSDGEKAWWRLLEYEVY